MDEPFSALDVLTGETLRTDFLDLWVGDQLLPDPCKSALLSAFSRLSCGSSIKSGSAKSCGFRSI
jgi:hypothetical protein